MLHSSASVSWYLTPRCTRLTKTRQNKFTNLTMHSKYKNKWITLLSPARLVFDNKNRPSWGENDETNENRSPFERDCERVLFSSPFRRLAGKTQVQPFPEIDYIHNRLTHSIEVASVSYSLAADVGRFLHLKGDIDERQKEHVCWIAKAAGMAHDIGNPAFGHAGEQAIKWWAQQPHAKAKLSCKEDFQNFDGNAEAFRMVVRNDLRNACHFHFTAASLGALVKYPLRLKGRNTKDKLGVFSSEEEIFDTLWEHLGLEQGNGTVRHPLSFLVEAADDICYRILDLEDAVRLNHLDESQVRTIFESFRPESTQKGTNQSIERLRGECIQSLVSCFADAFKMNYAEIIEGTFPHCSLKDVVQKTFPNIGAGLDAISNAYDKLFFERHKLLLETGCFHLYETILSTYIDIMEDVFRHGVMQPYGNLSCRVKKLIRLAWSEDYYEKQRNRKDADRRWWEHMVLDFITGMTDAYLNSLAQQLG